MVVSGRRCGKRAAQEAMADMCKLPPEQCAQIAADSMREVLANGQPALPNFPGHVRWMNFAPSRSGRVLFRMGVTLVEPLEPEGLTEAIIEVGYPWDTLAAADMYRLSRRWVFETMVASAASEIVPRMPKTRARLERDQKTYRDLAVVEWRRGE
jgi:hypothetical protein